MTLKELYEQTERSRINQLKIYENGEITFKDISAGFGSLKPYFDYNVLGIEPYVYYNKHSYDLNNCGEAINIYAGLRVVIIKEED